MVLVRLFNVSLRFEKPLEDEVLDEVGRGELRTARIEGLEDFLGVLGNSEVDNDHLEMLSDNGLKGGGPRGRVLTARLLQPLPRFLAEESMLFNHAFARVADRVMVDGRRRRHHRVEGWPITVGRPD